jgi:hypothetical protein
MSSRRLAVLLGLVLLVVVGPFVGPDTAQPASRYSLTASLAEHGSVDLEPYRERLGVDHALYRGHLRSDKAPGQPLLAVPVYLAGRAVGAESATDARERGDLGLWWVTLWSATLPFVILVALMFLTAERFARRNVALGVALLFGLTTMMLPHAVNLYGHNLAALLGFGAWLALDNTRSSARHAMLGGLLAGAAVLTEYDCGIVLFVLAGYVLVCERDRFGWFALGAVAPLGVLAWYHSIAFGAPWHTPSGYYAGTINGTSEGGYTIPGVHGLVSVLIGKRGVIIGAPIALVALVGAVWLAISGAGAARRQAMVALAIVVPFVVLCAGWSGLPLLEEPGPRYLIPALPFLAVPLAVMWDRLWRPAVLFAAWGALIAIPATITFILLGIGQPAVPELLRRVGDGDFLPTLWSMAFGSVGAVFYVGSVVIVVGLFARALDLFAPRRSRQRV